MSLTAVFRDAQSGEWCLFGPPRSVVSAACVSDVMACVREVEHRTRRDGLYAAGFVSYDAAPGFDQALRVLPGTSQALPLVWFGLFDPPTRTRVLPEPTGSGPATEAASWSPDLDRDEYDRATAQVRSHLEQGDTYQVNFTFQLRAPWRIDSWRLFHRLVRAQPARYSAYLDLGRFVIASASPELFFERHGRAVTCRPMKGTAPRGRFLGEDRAARHALITSEKNRAENVMIVDMVRNDLARVADVGSVQVKDLFTAERYRTLWQMTSTVVGESGADLADIMAALFPCASVTGAPKVRTSEIIAALETSPRGIYTGSLGMIAPDGSAQFSVAIRTVLVDRDSARATCGVGSGLVWDSRAEAEYDECLLKAMFLTAEPWEPTLLETLRWTRHQGYAWLDRHLQRLRSSADYLDIALDEDGVRARLADFAASHAADQVDLVVRLLVAPGGSISCRASPYLEAALPVRLAVADGSVSSGDVRLFHKTTDRSLYDHARAKVPWADDVVLWNELGHATETTIANLAVKLDSAWWTPPVAAGLLPGTYRAALIDQGRLRERDLPLDLVRRADEIAVVNSVRGWRPAVLRSAP